MGPTTQIAAVGAAKASRALRETTVSTSPCARLTGGVGSLASSLSSPSSSPSSEEVERKRSPDDADADEAEADNADFDEEEAAKEDDVIFLAP